MNLALHVTGQRDDGYHLLDSIVGFAVLDAPQGPGDILEIDFAHNTTGSGTTASSNASRPHLVVDGPFAQLVPMGIDNSVLGAARAVGGITRVRLTKNLPVEAGIGGGSADAAAVLRAAAEKTGTPVTALMEQALALGADVPVCLFGEPARMQGIGEAIVPIALPSLPCVLVNPGARVPTPSVFRSLSAKSNPGLFAPPATAEPGLWLSYLAEGRNDLEAPATEIAPVIGNVLSALRATAGCHLARMSGSGATVFGLFGDSGAAAVAAETLRSTGDGAWWIATGRLSGAGEDTAARCSS